MRTMLLLLLLAAVRPTMFAQPAHGGEFRLARDTFDPARHALARMRAGALELLVDQPVLLRSLQVRLKSLGALESVGRQQIGDAHFLVMHGWVSGGQYRRYLVAVRLREDADGYLFAEPYFDICMARDDAICSDCILTAAGCQCWANADAFCGNAVGNEMIFSKISIVRD
jgi:hypothetical protein